MNLVRAGIVVTTEEENQENDVNLTIFKTIQNIHSFQLLLLSKNMMPTQKSSHAQFNYKAH